MLGVEYNIRIHATCVFATKTLRRHVQSVLSILIIKTVKKLCFDKCIYVAINDILILKRTLDTKWTAERDDKGVWILIRDYKLWTKIGVVLYNVCAKFDLI